MKKNFSHKVLIHSNYSPANHGGIEFVVSILLRNFSEKYNLSCFFGGDSNYNVNISDNIQYVSRRIIIKVGGASLLSWGSFYFIAIAFKAKLIIFQEPYPTLWPAMFFIRHILRKKVIVLIHANPVSKTWVMKLYDRIRSFVFSGAICVTTSPNLLSKIKKTSFSRSLVIPLCIPDQEVTFAENLSLPKTYALYIGRLAQYKGIEYLLESAKLCSDVFFVIAGDGPLSSFVLDYICKNKIQNIQFINRFVTEEEKYELIERSSFVLFPSVSENEAFGLVQLEAMKSKKAIINTWLDSGVNYVAPDQLCALTVSRRNSKELAYAIRSLWSDPDFACKLGENGLDRFKTLFHEKMFINAWNSLLDECLSTKSDKFLPSQ